MPLADEVGGSQAEGGLATGSSLRASRSSDSSQCVPPSVSPVVPVNSIGFDCYNELRDAPDALEGDTHECLETSPVPCQTSGGHVARRWTRKDFLRLRALDWCTMVPQQLQDRPEVKALLKAPGLALRERVDHAAATPVAVETRNPRTVDLRFVRDEIASATEANTTACAWRKKAAPRAPEPSNARDPADNYAGRASRDWRGRRMASEDAWDPLSASGVGDEWLMPTGTGDYDLGSVKNDVELFEEMRKQARQEWAGTSPGAESETEDVLHQLMSESINGMEQSHADNGSDAVHALQNSQQIDVQSLFMDSGAPQEQSARGGVGSDHLAQPSGSGSAAVLSHSSSEFVGSGVPASMHADGLQPGQHAMFAFNGMPAGSTKVHDAVENPSAAASLNARSSSDSAQNQTAESDLGGEGSSIWGSGGAGRLAQDAPVSEVDWKMMREIWNRPANSAEGVQQQMQGMKLADSCIGSGQQPAPAVGAAGRFGDVAPQLAAGHSAAGGSTGGEGAGDANAMKVLMQLWNSNSEPTSAAQAPPQGKTSEQELSQQLMAFHQQHQKKKQAERQAAANGSAVSAEQMLDHFYQQRRSHSAREAHEPSASELYSQAMARAGHGGSQHMPHANSAYARQGTKPVYQQNGMNGQYSSQAQQLATVLWFQASMAQASQAAQTQRHQQQGRNVPSIQRTPAQDMYRGGAMNTHSAAALLQQLQQGSGSPQMSNDQYSAAAAAAVAAAQQQNISQTLRNQMYGAAEQKQQVYAPVSNTHMMRPNQGHSAQQGGAQVPNYAESVVRAMLLPTAARQHQAQAPYSQYRQPQAYPRYNNAAAGLQMPAQHASAQHSVPQSGFAHAQGSGVAQNNISHFYDAGRMRR